MSSSYARGGVGATKTAGETSAGVEGGRRRLSLDGGLPADPGGRRDSPLPTRASVRGMSAG